MACTLKTPRLLKIYHLTSYYTLCLLYLKQEEVLLTPMYEVPSMPDVEKVIITADTVNKKEPPTYIRRENIDEPVKRPIQASGLA